MKEYNLQRFMGTEINCNSNRPCTLRYIEDLYVLSNLSDTVFKKPLGFHLRIRLNEDVSMAKFSAMLSKHYRKSGYNPLRYTVKETDDTGVHYHIAIVIDGRKNKKSSISHILAKLQQAGYLHDYKVIAHNAHPFGHPLEHQIDKDSFFRWMSYLAKTKTKATGKQNSSPSKKLASLIKDWRAQGKPDLRIKVEGSATDLSTYMGETEFSKPETETAFHNYYINALTVFASHTNTVSKALQDPCKPCI